MKRLFFLLIGICFSVAGIAQNEHVNVDLHRTFLKQGKTWNYIYTHYEDQILEEYEYEGRTEQDIWPQVAYKVPVSYTLWGDTLIDGRQCMKMYWHGQDKARYVGAWYEEDYKVYEIPRGNTRAKLRFEFSQEYKKYSTVNVIAVNGNYFASYDLSDDVWQRENEDFFTDERIGLLNYSSGYFIEGIGTSNGILTDVTPTCPCDGEDFLSCIENGKIIFTSKDLYKFDEPYTGHVRGENHFLQNNKVWYYAYHEVNSETGKEKLSEVRYTLRGDTIINDYLCYRMYRQRSGEMPTYFGAWYEDGRKVYSLPEWEKAPNFRLFFDFGIEEGETMPKSWAAEVGWNTLLEKGTVSSYGHTFGLYAFDKILPLDDYSSVHFGSKLWIENVGNMHGILFDEPEADCLCDYETFESCWEEGGCIFSRYFYEKEQKNTNGIAFVRYQAPTILSGKTYDLQGREVTTPQPGHIYIKDGRKFMAK